MSSRASFVSVPSGVAEDAVTDNYIMQIVGARYEAAPNAVADGQIRGFQIDAEGRQVVLGGHQQNALAGDQGLLVGARARSTTPGPFTELHYAHLWCDLQGYLQVSDVQVSDLRKDAGVVDSRTLRVHLSDESLANVNEVQGDAADNAAASGNPVRIGGVYNTALPTYDNGDIGSLQIDANGYLLARTAGFDQDNAAQTANPLGVAGVYNATPPAYDDGDIAFLQMTSAGYLQVSIAGNPKHAGGSDADTLRTVIAADADNAAANERPIGIGGIYNATPPTYDDGDRTTLQGDANGNLKVAVETDQRTGLAIQNTAYNNYGILNLPGNASLPRQLIASTSADIKKIQLWDTAGVPFEIMTGAAASESRLAVFGPGVDGEFELNISSGTRVSVRRIDDTPDVAVGDITANFLG